MNRIFAALFALFAAFWTIQANAGQFQILKAGTALYVWTPGFRPGYSKAWRLQINTVPSATESGVVDFLGERMIPASTTQATFGANYNASTEILRTGDEESPPIYMAGQGQSLGYYGGNHRYNGFDTISGYSLIIRVDGTRITTDGWYVGSSLLLDERYGINTGISIDNPIMVQVHNTWEFDGSDFCRFKHDLTAVRSISLGWWGGMQFQKPFVAAGRTMTMYIPGSITYGQTINGVDITNEANALTVGVADWINPASPPLGFELTIKAAGAPQWTFGAYYDENSYRGEMQTAFFRSTNLKSYPRAVDFSTPLSMNAGQSIGISGHFGTYNGH